MFNSILQLWLLYSFIHLFKLTTFPFTATLLSSVQFLTKTPGDFSKITFIRSISLIQRIQSRNKYSKGKQTPLLAGEKTFLQALMALPFDYWEVEKVLICLFSLCRSPPSHFFTVPSNYQIHSSKAIHVSARKELFFRLLPFRTSSLRMQIVAGDGSSQIEFVCGKYEEFLLFFHLTSYCFPELCIRRRD